jgi:hypothetical protein
VIVVYIDLLLLFAHRLSLWDRNILQSHIFPLRLGPHVVVFRDTPQSRELLEATGLL